MTTSLSPASPPPALAKCFKEAQALCAAGTAVLRGVEAGENIAIPAANALAEELGEALTRFRKEWAAQRTKLPDGRTLFTPDYLALKEFLGAVGKEVEELGDQKLKIDEASGRVVGLQAGWMGISDLTALSSLTALEKLWLDYNQISDLTPLSSLTALTVLGLRANPLSANSRNLIDSFTTKGVTIKS